MYNYDDNFSIYNIDPHRYDGELVYNPYIAQEIMEDHYHTYKITTDNTYDHNHIFEGRTLRKILKGNTHVHYFEAKVETKNGIHEISGETRPSVEFEGGHRHFIKGITTPDKRHFHFFEQYTSEDLNFNEK